jgi:hypothetical protein
MAYIQPDSKLDVGTRGIKLDTEQRGTRDAEQRGTFEEDISKRKEFYMMSATPPKALPTDIAGVSVVPEEVIQNQLRASFRLQLRGHQLFCENFINPLTPYKRIHLKHDTGSGKTVTVIVIALNFLHAIQELKISGHVIVFGFTKSIFRQELLKYPNFGFVTFAEIAERNRLRSIAAKGNVEDIIKLRDYNRKLKRKLRDKFTFYGYKEFVTKIFVSETYRDLTMFSSEEIQAAVQAGEIKISEELLAKFENSIVICDEIHNVYNSYEKNNWGIALQFVLDRHKNSNMRVITLSATPILAPAEIVDLVNLLVPDANLKRSELFDGKQPKPGTIERLANLMRGHVSYLREADPAYYPRREIMGETIPTIDYLRFIRCPLSAFQQATLLDAEAVGRISGPEYQYIHDIVYPNPNDSKIGIFRTNEMPELIKASPAWRQQHGVEINSGNISGDWLHLHSSSGRSGHSGRDLSFYSGKYATMVEDILNLSRHPGKIFIYHPYVRVSGVLLIQEILVKNGFISHHGIPTADTICALCGILQKNHIRGAAAEKHHTFVPARFITIYSDIDKNIIDRLIEQFNIPDNAFGTNIKVLIGSKIMHEAYDLKAVQHIFIMGRPDHIPELLQIMGRAIRRMSAVDLPPEMRLVRIRIYVGSVPGKSRTHLELSDEEEKYKQKIAEYKIIQKVEKHVLHEIAVDACINRELIEHSQTNDPLAPLPFKPLVACRKYTLGELTRTTFNAFYQEEEINQAIYKIKRLFINQPVWKYKDLFNAVSTYTLDLPYVPSVISEYSFKIALYLMIVDRKQPNITVDNTIDYLINPMYRKIYINGQDYTIIASGEYFILVPIENDNPIVFADAPYRFYEASKSVTIDIKDYVEIMQSKVSFDNRLDKFYKMYKSVNLEEMNQAIGEYNITFHLQLIELCIEYVYHILTGSHKHRDPKHLFYFKMIAYYATFNLIIFTPGMPFSLMAEYPFKPVKQTAQLQQHMLERDLMHTTCSWCISTVEQEYKMYNELGSTCLKSNPKLSTIIDTIPIGHFLGDVPRFYTIRHKWISMPNLVQYHIYEENDIIIGYDAKIKDALIPVFKMRSPLQQRTISDSRLLERGSVCTTKSKGVLEKIAERLSIPVDRRNNVVNLCQDIRAKLIQLELRERKRKTNIKWFYHHWEIQPLQNL